MTAQREELMGIPASPGVALGTAMVASRHHSRVPRHHIQPADCSYQLQRLQEAIEASREELEQIRDGLGNDAPADYRLILEAHLLMHRDELLIDSASKAVCEQLVNAEWAMERSISTIKAHLAQAPHAYFRERAEDVENVGRKIIAQLVGRGSSLPPMRSEGVLVVDDLHPADAAQLIRSPVAALVTGLGSATSHTAILARTLEIPSVVGVKGVAQRVGSGDLLVVDALTGKVVVEPTPEEAEQARARATRYRQFKRTLRAHGATAISRDGVELSLMANVDLPEEVSLAVDDNVAGIGLYRTEFLFMNRPTPPDEAEQLGVYRAILAAAGDRPVVFRTFDLGGDNLTTDPYAELGPNPALGLRAIRLALSRRAVFRTQLRAVLRASVEGKVRLMFPLVSGLSDLRRAKAALDEARAELSDRGQAYGDIEVGVMIELPAAVMMADKLAEEVDFMAVGTNDLVQYALAVDRTNPSVAYMADPLDPAVLRLLQRVVQVATDKGLPLSMCGDMAANPVSLPIVLGLGFRTLSLPLSAMPLSREIVREIDLGEATAAAEDALDCGTAGEVHQVVRDRFSAALRELWDEAGVVL